MSYEIIYSDELAHHGILGMKWGVRRYQNSDGSLTKEGLKRYRQSEQNYNSAKEKHLEAKAAYKEAKESGKDTSASKNAVKQSRKDLKLAKKDLSRKYDQLEKDKKADKGKDLYAQGKRITTNKNITRLMESAALGTGTLGIYLQNEGNKKMSNIAYTGAALLGMAALTQEIRSYRMNNLLSAYYGHSRKD